MKMKKTIPALPVKNIDESVKFYSEKLGFTAPYYDDGFAKVVRDEIEIHLWASSDESWKNKGLSLVADPICSGAESFLAGTASCRIEVQGIDELYEEYKKQGVIYDTDTVVQEQPWGDREFPALDHHRNLLTFYEEI
ncbi:bleomycin resistance protein [Dyadobacter sp. BHUBP1]|uniref:Bleomycin resistance protein n=2 Tax=Cytophagales TaxID=768507 RepID=A0A916JCK8_9BACT|nr:Bleomycin resistance protein [Dyadobacter sp. CECT 9275]